MASLLEGIFEPDLRAKIIKSKVLVVGAGGIGCELLKNLVMTGFQDIEIIDLDTIDVSNLNRQFLFHKQHVGKSKAAVAAESALKFNPNAEIIYYHDNVMKTDYDIGFFTRFSVVLNALDNLTARYHVNRMCVAAGVPLIESGTSGYLGQVEVISAGLTSCYECQPRKRPKEIASCTIRNTPTEPIHCIVWSKHLFNQLFGESDAEDISPDVMDPSLKDDKEFQDKPKPDRVSTRLWVEQVKYDPLKLFKKIFHDDIEYLLSMTVLWNDRGRKKPTPIDFVDLPDSVAGSSKEAMPMLRDMAVWSVKECADVFSRTIKALKQRMDTENGPLVWDKDDNDAMDFVAACSNIRAHIFQIPQKSRWEVKSIAGSIIPAIATTNAVIAGVVVLKAINMLEGNIERYTSVYLRRNFTQGKLLADEKYMSEPNPKCIVCKSDAVVELACNLNKFTVTELDTLVLKKDLHFVAPDVRVKSTYHYIISSEAGETDDNNFKTLQEMNITCGETLQVEDFLQNFTVNVRIKHYEAIDAEPLYVLKTFDTDLNPLPLEEVTADNNVEERDGKGVTTVADNDDCEVVEQLEFMNVEPVSLKRKIDDGDSGPVPAKKQNVDNGNVGIKTKIIEQNDIEVISLCEADDN